MKCAVLAAGEGTRMRPLTQNKPKVMLPFAGKPMLHHVIDVLKQAGFSEFVFLVGYKGDAVKEYFGDGSKFGIKIDYATQKEQLGTANALHCMREFLEKDADGFVQINGDTLIKVDDVRALAKSKSTMMTVREVPNPCDFGVLEVKANAVVKIVEKPKVPPSNLANVGVYKFFPDIFNAIDHTQLSARNEYEITDSLQLLIDSGKKVAYNKVSWWLDVGKPWDLLSANEMLMKEIRTEIKGTVEQYVTLKGAVQIGEGTVVMSGAYIEGPAIIGKNCKIGPNCYIRPSTFIGDRCHIGAGTEVKNSIIMSNSNAPHINYVGDCVIGERCNLGAGTKIANLRHDGHNVYSTLKDQVVDTGRRKLGAIIGDDVKTGINVSINVGTVIGGGVAVAYGRSVNGYVPPGARVF